MSAPEITHRCWRIVATFACAALIGPLIAFIAGAYDLHARDSAELRWLSRTIYDLTLMVWPTQVLGVMEVSSGATQARLVAVACNIVVFAVLGALVCFALVNRIALSALFALVVTAVIWLSVTIAGHDLEFLSWGALLLALGFYAALFWNAFRTGSSSA